MVSITNHRLPLPPLSPLRIQIKPRTTLQDSSHDLLAGSEVSSEGRVGSESDASENGSGKADGRRDRPPLARLLRRRRGPFGRKARRAGRDRPGHAVG